MTGAEKIAAVLGGAHRSGDWWRCRCPVHGSRGATLALRDGDRGLIVKCFADCDPRDILAELRRRRLITGRGDDAGPAPPIIRRDNHADVRRRHASPARVVVDEDHDLAHAWHAIPTARRAGCCFRQKTTLATTVSGMPTGSSRHPVRARYRRAASPGSSTR